MTSARTRTRMVERLREQGIADEVVLAAMNAVPRHIFVDEALAIRAYDDVPLPIGSGQTISQPWVVARMTELARNGRELDARARDRHRLRLPDRGARAHRAPRLQRGAHRRAGREGAAQPAVAQAAQRVAQARRRQPRPQGGARRRRDRGDRGRHARARRRCCAISSRAAAWCCRSRNPATSAARSG